MRAFLASIARERSFEPATGEDCINALEILECNRAFFDIALEAEEGIKIQHGRAWIALGELMPSGRRCALP